MAGRVNWRAHCVEHGGRARDPRAIGDRPPGRSCGVVVAARSPRWMSGWMSRRARVERDVGPRWSRCPGRAAGSHRACRRPTRTAKAAAPVSRVAQQLRRFDLVFRRAALRPRGTRTMDRGSCVVGRHATGVALGDGAVVAVTLPIAGMQPPERPRVREPSGTRRRFRRMSTCTSKNRRAPESSSGWTCPTRPRRHAALRRRDVAGAHERGTRAWRPQVLPHPVWGVVGVGGRDHQARMNTNERAAPGWSLRQLVGWITSTALTS